MYPSLCTLNLEFNCNDFQTISSHSTTIFTINDGEFNSPPGTPLLPEMSRIIPLPSGTVIDQLLILKAEFETLPGNYQLATTQPPVPLSLSSPPSSLDLKPEITRLSSFYPETLCMVTGYGYRCGQKLASLVITPLQYQPVTHKIRRLRRLQIAFKLRESEGLQPSLPVAGHDSCRFEYLIVTRENLDSVFQDLCYWRTLTGTPAQIRHIEWIENRYPGRDDAEKLRAYLQQCARDSGLKYLLLGGDTDILPFRKAIALVSGAGLHPREDSLPCDLYFSALDGNWDGNNNGIFGEPDDEVDLFPEIYVGRAPVSTPAAARIFVNKILAYERTLLNDYQRRAVLAGAILWENPWTDEMLVKERIRREHFPSDFQIQTLYESMMPVTTDTVTSLLNSGFGIFNHCGHGWINAIAVSRQCVLRNPDIDHLTNNTRTGIVYSIGCWTTAFDFDCVAEHFLLNPAGGAVAFIGNSSYGWGAPGNPGFGYSDRFDSRFFQELFSDPAPRLGEVFARTKTHFIPYSYSPNVYRWHQFALNLLGDPAMPVHTDTLSQLMVSKPLRIRTGSDIALFIVLDRNGPVPDATVAIYQGSASVYTGTTGTDGTAAIQTAFTQVGTARLTVTAQNHRPLYDSVVVASEHSIVLLNYTFIDSAGDGNGCISAGETFAIRLWLKNNSPLPLYNVLCRLTTDSPLLTVEQDAGHISILPPDSSVCARLFLIRTSNHAQNRDYALCTLTITELNGRFSQFPVIIQFRQPFLKFVTYYVCSDTLGSYSAFFRVVNTGAAPAPVPTGTLFNPDLTQPLTLLTPGIVFPSILPGETLWSSVPARFNAESGPVRIGLNLITGRFIFSDTLKVHLPPAGIYASFDSGLGNWTAAGANGSWFLTRTQALSPPYSIHAGYPADSYPPNCTCELLSPKFPIPPCPRLKFSCYYELPLYGSDGLYCIIRHAGQEETLDFIGAGGALRPGNQSEAQTWDPGNRWFNYSYELSASAPGETAQLKFAFVSDPDPQSAAGFFLDDISVASADFPPSTIPESTRLFTLFPCPFRNRTTIFLTLSRATRIDLAIFNTAGGRVRTLISGNIPAGWHSVGWDGTDDNNRAVPAGIYFLRMNYNSEPDHAVIPPAHTHLKIIKL
ncbi:MAG: C25 family cysteine peptidase [candidate division WOR-3 bacterium]|nr:C25 family cysteine peptidase [candidate division WOR-3 bacterium]